VTNPCGAASVQLSGVANSSYSSITVPTTFTISSGADNMTVGTLRVRYGIAGTAGVTTGPGTLSGTGTGLLVLTATLFVNATQASGTYTGTVSVTVDY
jgi:spore coat protein U-like protein